MSGKTTAAAAAAPGPAARAFSSALVLAVVPSLASLRRPAVAAGTAAAAQLTASAGCLVPYLNPFGLHPPASAAVQYGPGLGN